MRLLKFLPAGFAITVAMAIAMTLALGGPALAHEAHEKQAAARVQAAAAASAPPGSTLSTQHGDAAMPGMTGAMDHGGMMADGAMVDDGPKTVSQRLFGWLGRMHPAVVHFPIALFVVAGFLEAAALTLRRPVLTEGTRVLVALAAISAIVAAALGWLSMGLPGPTEDATHTWHRWLGSSIAGLGVLTWWAKEQGVRRPSRGREQLFVGLLATTVAFVMVNGLLGSVLSRGVKHLMF